MDSRQKVINAIALRRQAVSDAQKARQAQQAAERFLQEAESELARQLKNYRGVEKRVFYDGYLYWAWYRSTPAGAGTEPQNTLSVGIEPANFEILKTPQEGGGCHEVSKPPTVSGGKR